MSRTGKVAHHEAEWEKRDHDRSLWVCMFGADMIYPLNPVQTMTEITSRVEAIILDIHFGLPFILMDAVEDEDQLRLGKSLVFVFRVHDQNLALLKYILDFETVRSVNVYNLFMQRGISVHVLRTYLKLIGLPYISHILRPLMSEIIKKKVVRDDDKEDELITHPLRNINVWTLLESSQRALDAVLMTTEHIPDELFIICSYFRHVCGERYPSETHYPVVGTVFFTHFVCRAICQPYEYGLIDEEPTRDQERLFLLIGKAIRKVARTEIYDDDDLSAMNVFIDSNVKQVQSFLDTISSNQVNPNRKSTSLYFKKMTVPNHVLFTSLDFIHSNILKSSIKIDNIIHENSDLIEIKVAY
eukprot:Nk52_evm65s554 gene=Nk52_evmTU65s554